MPICYLLFYIEIKITGRRQDYFIMYVNLNYFDSEDFILPSDILINPFCLKCDLVRLSLLIVCFIFFCFFPPVTVTVEGRSTLCLCSSCRWADPTRPNCCYRYQLLGWKKNKKKKRRHELLASCLSKWRKCLRSAHVWFSAHACESVEWFKYRQ